MFAPKLAKPPPTAAMLRHSTQGVSRLAVDKAVERYEQQAAPEKACAAWCGPAYDFSKIALLPPDRAYRTGRSSSLAATPLPGAIQAKLTVGKIDDPLEHEADRVADQVMRMPQADAVSGVVSSQVSQKCAQGEKETRLYAMAAAPVANVAEAPASVHAVLRSPGQSLDPATRGFMESRFGRDFSGVRVHTGSAAAQSARDVNAHAYTVGNSVAFGAGQFAPETNKGRRLLAHELTHVVQQQSPAGKVSGTPPALQRELVTSATGATDVNFTVGKEIAPALATAAKAAVAKGPLDDTELKKLRTAALASDETVDDNERMFIAGLLDPANARQLKTKRFDAGDTIQFSVASISPARRARIADLERPAYPAKVAAEARSAVTAAGNRDPMGAIKHAASAITETYAEVDRLIVDPKFNALAHAAMTRAGILAVPAVLRAMISAASDSTPGDMALAGAVYVVSVEIGSPLADDILHGNIKVDEKPKSAMRGNLAAYMSAGNTDKGDTITMSSDFDINNLMHRAEVVHELKHAESDKASTGSTVQFIARDRDEMRAYRTHNRYALDSIAGLNSTQRATAIAQVAAEWNEIDAAAMALEARPDPLHAAPTFKLINAAAAPGVRLADNIIDALLTADVARVENALLVAIRAHYGLTTDAKNKMVEDGLKGQSILDWINRPLATGP